MQKTGENLVCERCGATYYRARWAIRRGDSKFCSRLCQNRSQAERSPNLKHGLASNGVMTQEYRAYHSMMGRCYNPKDSRYHDWGGRGIRVCKRWRDGSGELSGLECFLEDMGPKPSSEHVLDRYPNLDGNYEPNNCRWATKKESSQNRRFTPKWRIAFRQQIRKNVAGSRWITNGQEEAKLKMNQSVLPIGWVYGRLKRGELQ
jgi:hypothetical protein